MNSLESLLKVSHQLSDEKHSLSAYEAARFNVRTRQGKLIADVGCEPILNMRYFQVHILEFVCRSWYNLSEHRCLGICWCICWSFVGPLYRRTKDYQKNSYIRYFIQMAMEDRQQCCNEDVANWQGLFFVVFLQFTGINMVSCCTLVYQFVWACGLH